MEPGFCSLQKAHPAFRWVQCRLSAQDRGGGGAGPHRDAGETEAAAAGWLPEPRPSSLPLCSSNASAKSSGLGAFCKHYPAWHCGGRVCGKPSPELGLLHGHVGPAQPSVTYLVLQCIVLVVPFHSQLAWLMRSHLHRCVHTGEAVYTGVDSRGLAGAG